MGSNALCLSDTCHPGYGQATANVAWLGLAWLERSLIFLPVNLMLGGGPSRHLLRPVPLVAVNITAHNADDHAAFLCKPVGCRDLLGH